MISPEVAASASDLVVRRQGHVILDGLTFTIPRGQVTGLLGPSGCGKTTLMRTLVGVQVIDAGQVDLLPGSVAPLLVVAVLDALLGMSLGLFASAFARTEFQAVQFMPALVLPQTLLCGIVVAREQMTDVLRWLSDVLPLSYAVDAMQQISGGAA